MIVNVNPDSRYTLTYDKGKYYIKNNELSSINVELKMLSCGKPGKTIKKISINPNKQINLQIELFTGDIGIFINSDTGYNNYIINYDVLIDYIASTIVRDVCGCGSCKDCENDTCTNSKIYNQLLSKVLIYNIKLNPHLNKYISVISKVFNCDISDSLICSMNDYVIEGNSESEVFVKKAVLYHYLILFLKESLQTTTKEEAEYIKEKYRYDEIEPCIRKMGIDVDKIIEEVMSDVKVSYWQFNNIISDINSVVNSWTPTYIQNLPGVQDRPLEDFEQGVVVNYTSVGRIGFAISETELINFTIVDSLGNDVTDNFDTHYFNNEKTAVFVSKLQYSVSNIYFKFKKNIYI